MIADGKGSLRIVKFPCFATIVLTEHVNGMGLLVYSAFRVQYFFLSLHLKKC